MGVSYPAVNINPGTVSGGGNMSPTPPYLLQALLQLEEMKQRGALEKERLGLERDKLKMEQSQYDTQAAARSDYMKAIQEFTKSGGFQTQVQTGQMTPEKFQQILQGGQVQGPGMTPSGPQGQVTGGIPSTNQSAAMLPQLRALQAIIGGPEQEGEIPPHLAAGLSGVLQRFQPPPPAAGITRQAPRLSPQRPTPNVPVGYEEVTKRTGGTPQEQVAREAVDPEQDFVNRRNAVLSQMTNPLAAQMFLDSTDKLRSSAERMGELHRQTETDEMVLKTMHNPTPERRKDMALYLKMQRAAKSGMDAKLMKTLAPSLFEGNDTEQVKAFFNVTRQYGKDGYSLNTEGDIWDSLGLEGPFPGKDRNVRSFDPSFLTGGGRGSGGLPNETDMKWLAHFTNMQLAHADINRLMKKEIDPTTGKARHRKLPLMVGIMLKTDMVGQKDQTWIEGVAKAFSEKFAGEVMSAEDKQLLVAIKNFASAWRYVVTGAQATNAEMATLISIATPSLLDDEETIEYKSKIRERILNGLRDGLQNRTDMSGMLNEMLGDKELNLRPEDRKFFEKQLQHAEKYESDIKSGRRAPRGKMFEGGVEGTDAKLDALGQAMKDTQEEIRLMRIKQRKK